MSIVISPTNLTPVDPMININEVEKSLVDIQNADYAYLYKAQKELISVKRFNTTASELIRYGDFYVYDINYNFIGLNKRIDFKTSEFYDQLIDVYTIEGNPDIFDRSYVVFMNGEMYRNIRIRCFEDTTVFYFNYSTDLDKILMDSMIDSNADIMFMMLPTLQTSQLTYNRTSFVNGGGVIPPESINITHPLKHPIVFANTSSDTNKLRLVESTYNPVDNTITINNSFNSSGSVLYLAVFTNIYLDNIVKIDKSNGVYQNFVTSKYPMPVPLENIIVFLVRRDGSRLLSHKEIITMSYPNSYNINLESIMADDDYVGIEAAIFYMDDSIENTKTKYENFLQDLYTYYDDINRVTPLENIPDFGIYRVVNTTTAGNRFVVVSDGGPITPENSSRIISIDILDDIHTPTRWNSLDSIDILSPRSPSMNNHISVGFSDILYTFFYRKRKDETESGVSYKLIIDPIGVNLVTENVFYTSETELEIDIVSYTHEDPESAFDLEYSVNIIRYDGNNDVEFLLCVQLYNYHHNFVDVKLFKILPIDMSDLTEAGIAPITLSGTGLSEGVYANIVISDNNKLYFTNANPFGGERGDIIRYIDLSTYTWGSTPIVNDYSVSYNSVVTSLYNNDGFYSFPRYFSNGFIDRALGYVKVDTINNTSDSTIYSDYMEIFNDDFIPSFAETIGNTVILMDKEMDIRVVTDRDSWYYDDKNVNIFLRDYKIDSFLYNIPEFRKYAELNPSREDHVQYKLDALSTMLSKYPSYLRNYNEKLLGIPNVSIIDLGEFKPLTSIMQSRGRTTNSGEITDLKKHVNFSTIHLVFKIENNESINPQNISLFFNGYFYPYFKMYTNNDGYDYLYIDTKEPEGFNPLLSTSPIIQFIYKEINDDFLPVIQIERHDSLMKKYSLVMSANSSIELPRMDTVIVEDVSLVRHTLYGNTKATPITDYSIQSIIYDTDYEISDIPYSLLQGVRVDVKNSPLNLYINNTYYLYTEVIQESNVTHQLNLINNYQFNSSKFRVFVNGKFLSNTYYIIETYMENIVLTLNLLLNEGDVVHIEILPIDTNEEIYYNKQFVDGNLIADLVIGIEYPFSNNYNRVYVNGKRLSHHEIVMINPYKIAIQNVNIDTQIGSVKNVTITGPKRLGEGSYLLNKEAQVIVDVDKFTEDAKKDKLQPVDDFIEDMIDTSEEYTKILKRRFLDELDGILVEENKYIIPTAIFDDYVTLVNQYDEIIIDGGENIDKEDMENVILDPNK